MGSKHDFFPAMAIMISILGIIYLSIRLKGKVSKLKAANRFTTKSLILNLLLYFGGMVSLTISLLIFSMILDLAFFGIREPPQYVEKTQIMLGQVHSAITMFYNDCGKFPAENDWMEALTKSNYCTPGEPYLRRKPTDGWGRDFIYKVFPDHVEIKSLGADGKEGGEGKAADIIEIIN